LTANRLGTTEIMREAGVAKTCVWRWQERFMNEGADGLLRDKTRPSRIPALTDQTVMRVVSMTLEPPSGEVTHWTAVAMAEATGVSVSSVQRRWPKFPVRPTFSSAWCSPVFAQILVLLPREVLHKQHHVILSAAKNPGILHSAVSVQNDNPGYAEVP
jgi:Homeodomain-like domain